MSIINGRYVLLLDFSNSKFEIYNSGIGTEFLLGYCGKIRIKINSNFIFFLKVSIAARPLIERYLILKMTENPVQLPKQEKLTVEKVRKRAEHNDGVLYTLEEVAMHQDEIFGLTNVLEVNCPKLKIIYLQNNYIPKIEYLSKLTQLEYLNLALNNIEIVEGLEGCEKLNKLDLTCNFIVDITSVKSLQGNYNLKELYLIGNPCDKFEGYRDFVIGTLPQLEVFDGAEVKPSERNLAKRNLAVLKQKMIDQIAMYEPKNYTPEERLETWKSIEETKKKNSPPPPKDPRDEYGTNLKVKAPPAGPDASGRIIQCNQGKWNFKWKDEKDLLILDVAINRYLDTSQIQIDVNPTWVRIEAKGKVLQLILPNEVSIDNVEALRSETSGNLVLKMQKIDKSPFIRYKTPADIV